MNAIQRLPAYVERLFSAAKSLASTDVKKPDQFANLEQAVTDFEQATIISFNGEFYFDSGLPREGGDE